MLSAAIKGFMVTLSLIVAIGAQNTFVLKQSLKQRYIFYTIFTCVLIDVIMVSAGVFGIGYIVQNNPLFIKIMTLLGIAFLVIYALLCLYSAFKGKYLEEDESTTTKSLKQTIIVLLLLSLLNPHVYLDTLIIMGGIGAIYPSIEDKLSFIVGMALASTLWFSILGYGSRFLLPLFKKKITWRILDTLIAVIMFLIAYSLYNDL